MNSIFYRRFSLLLSLTAITVLGRGFSAQAETIMVPSTKANSAAALAPQLAPNSASALKLTQADINTEPSPGVDTTAPSSEPATDPTAPAPTGAISFADVGADYWAEPFIQALAARNVIAGFPDATFKPEQPVTRAEFAAMLQKAFPQNPVQRQLTGGFSDVPSDYWAASAIQTAYETGFVDGYPNNSFQPNQEIAKVQAITALANGLGLNPSSPAADVVSIYTDAGLIPPYALEQVAAATQANVVVNYPDVKTLNPEAALTRAEAAAHLYQALVQSGQVQPLPANVAAASYIVGGPGSVSQATPTAPEETAPTETPPNLDVQPGRATRGGSSYLGVAANFGIDGNTNLGDDVSFTVLSKIGLLNFVSVRPAVLIGDDATILVPLTYDFNSRSADAFSETVSIAPYAGAGVGITTGDDTDVGFLLTGGLDVPLTPQFTATAAVNALFGDDTDVGVWVGVGYNFRGF